MHGDIFATKGIEYLIVIAYLVALAGAVRWFASLRDAAGTRAARVPRRVPWFALADGYHYHPGHSWAVAEADAVRVGLDDFTAQLVGKPDAVDLPRVGDVVRQGERGWQIKTQGRMLAMVAPVEGEVVEVNPAVLAAPGVATDDPYGAGWLFKVRPPPGRPRASLKNLLSGELAAAWLRHSAERLRAMPAAELGVLMPDGGAPVRGFGLVLDPAEWDAVGREFFLMD